MWFHSLWLLFSCSVMCVKLFYDLMDGSIPDSSVYGVLQARILEWLAISFSRGSSQIKDQTRVSSIGTLPLSHQGSQSLWYLPLKPDRPGCPWCKAKLGFGDRPGDPGPTQYGFLLPDLQPERAKYRLSMGPKTRKCSTEMKGESSPPLCFILCHSTLSPSFLTSEFLLPWRGRSMLDKQEFMLTVFILESSVASRGRETWENICLGW